MKNLLLKLFGSVIAASIAGLILSVTPAYAADTSTPINTTTFPDANFRSWVVGQYDTDNSGYLDDTALTETAIYIGSRNISDLTGIRYFPALTILVCPDNQLTSLDVSQNAALRNLQCSDNLLATLDVSNNPNLYELSCDGNQLTSLDLSSNTALYSLDCYDNQLTSLNINGSFGLKLLNCGYNQLASLDLSGTPQLLDLDCYYNQLTSLDLSANALLENISCNDNQIGTLDFSNNTVLDSIHCGNNQLTSLNVSRNVKIWWLTCGNNQLTYIDVSNKPQLVTFDCSNNQLTSLDISGSPRLSELRCSNNLLYDVKLSPSASFTTYAAANQSVAIPAVADAANPGAYVSSGSFPLAAGHGITLGAGASYTASTGSFRAAALNTPYTFSTTSPQGTISGTVTLVQATTTYTVTFVDWDGRVLLRGTVAAGGSAIAPGSPTRPGYQFVGWDRGFSNVSSNLTVTAVYQIGSTVPPGGMLQGAAGSIGTKLAAGMVLDIKGGSTAPGAPVVIWNEHNQANQRFYLEPDGEGCFWIVNVKSNMVLDAYGGSTAPGTPVIQWPKTGGDNQKWRLVGNGSNGFIIASKIGWNSMIDVSGASSAPGTPLVIWPNHYATGDVDSGVYAANQHFSFNAAQPSAAAAAVPNAAVLRSALPPRTGTQPLLADIHSGSQASGAAAVVWTANGGQNQKFKLVFDVTTGYYSILTFDGAIPKALDINGGQANAGTAVIQWDRHGGLNQKWYIDDAGGGYVYIRSAINGSAIDIANAGGAGSQLIVWPFHGGNNQKWAIAAG